TTVDTITQPSRVRPVGKNVPEMRVAIRATHFRAAHHEVAIIVLAQRVLAGRCVEARPASPGVIFGFGAKQRCATNDAFIHASPLLLIIRMAEGALRAALLRYVKLLRR